MKYLTYDDVLIRPNYSTVLSRKDVDLKMIINNYRSFNGPMDLLTVDIPVCSSNMDTITGHDMAVKLVALGCLAFLPRTMSIEENIDLYYDIVDSLEEIGLQDKQDNIIPSIGTGDYEYKRFLDFYKIGFRKFCIDVAHGHSIHVKETVKKIRDYQYKGENKDPIIVIAGNIATENAALDYQDWGVDIAKVGIGPGSVCTTRLKTGVGVPQISAIQECSKIIPVIADGGIRSPGCAAKAFAAGASLVMLGNMLAGTDEAPGVVTISNGKSTKPFYGMSSVEANKKIHGQMPKYKTDEGIYVDIPCKGPVEDIINDLAGGLRSACSYVGIDNLMKFKYYATLIPVTSASYIEGTPHINS